MLIAAVASCAMSASEPISKRPLEGRRIAVPEHRELDRLGGMLEAHGALAQGELRGRRVAVQLYPAAPTLLVDFLADAGALADPVWPYVYRPAVGGEAIGELIGEIAAGRVDALAFTSAAQIPQLFALA